MAALGQICKLRKERMKLCTVKLVGNRLPEICCSNPVGLVDEKDIWLTMP